MPRKSEIVVMAIKIREVRLGFGGLLWEFRERIWGKEFALRANFGKKGCSAAFASKILIDNSGENWRRKIGKGDKFESFEKVVGLRSR